MKFTNKTGLPDFLFQRLTKDYYGGSPDENHFSVTEILNSPRQVWLKRRHDHECERDVLTVVYAVQGSLMHQLLEQLVDDSIQEERLKYHFGDLTVSGGFDRYDYDLWDFKYTTVWTWIKNNNFDRFTQQLNLYAFLLRRAGFDIGALGLIEIFRDWSANAFKNGRYNKYDKNKQPWNVEVLPIKEMTDMACEELIQQRLTLINSYRNTPDNDLPACNEEERWQDPVQYAVMKRGRKTSLKNCDTMIEAKTFLNKHKDYATLYIEERPSTPSRCPDILLTKNGITINFGYCPYNKWCNWWKQYKNDHAEINP